MKAIGIIQELAKLTEMKQRSRTIVFWGALVFCVCALTVSGDLLVTLPYPIMSQPAILQYNERTGAFVTIFSHGRFTEEMEGCVFGPDDNLYVTANYLGYGAVLRYSGGSGGFLGAFVAPGAGGLWSPTGLVFGPDGNLYVSSYGTSSVLRYNSTTGAFIDTFVLPGSGGLGRPRALVFGADGNLYVCSENNNSVLRYDGSTGAFIDAFVS